MAQSQQDGRERVARWSAYLAGVEARAPRSVHLDGSTTAP
jgi:hypothetical protein